VRVTIALVQDFITGYAYPVMLTDFAILILVSFLIFLSWKGSINRIGLIVGIVITILLGINFLQFGGSSGYTKFNYYVGIYVIVILYGRWRLNVTILFHLVILLGIIIADYVKAPFVQTIFIRISPQIKDFWFAIFLVSGVGYFLKTQTDIFSNNLFNLNSDLAFRIKQARQINQLLEKQNKELVEAQQHLEREIQKRSEVLERKNDSIEEFMMVNTSHLVNPINDLVGSVRKKEGASVLSELLKQSADDLEKVSYSIREAVQKHPLIDRQNIK